MVRFIVKERVSKPEQLRSFKGKSETLFKVFTAVSTRWVIIVVDVT